MPYVGTSWASGDEVTSAKLQQMSANDAYFNENMIHGNLNFLVGSGGGPVGRTPGAVTGLRFEAVRYDFDSVTAVQVFTFQVPIPAVFTTAPICAISYNVTSYFTIIHSSEGDRTDYVEFYCVEKDQQYVRFVGKMSILMFGA